jgi:hypothetical protein
MHDQVIKGLLFVQPNVQLTLKERTPLSYRQLPSFVPDSAGMALQTSQCSHIFRRIDFACVSRFRVRPEGVQAGIARMTNLSARDWRG